MSAAVFQSGSLLGGKYRVLNLLGQGGMGAVYLAENVDIGRQVAIKVLKPELATDPQVIARFRQEARAAAAIGHPGIVDVLDMGALDDGGAYIVMERLSGQTLREKLASGGGLTVAEAVATIAEVLEILGAAHDAGVIHRDLKPDNIFLVEKPVRAVKILDFGISKFRSSGDMALTRTGMVMGTPLYMSPEQARGSRDVGPGADLYSIGAILYEMLAGGPPFSGESYNEVLAQVLTDPPRPIAELNPQVAGALGTTVESMLAKKAEARPPNAREAAARLRAALAGAAPEVGATVMRPSRADVPAYQTGPGTPHPLAPVPDTGPKLDRQAAIATQYMAPSAPTPAPVVAPQPTDPGRASSGAGLYIGIGGLLLGAIAIGIVVGQHNSAPQQPQVVINNPAAPASAPVPVAAPAPPPVAEPVPAPPPVVAAPAAVSVPAKPPPAHHKGMAKAPAPALTPSAPAAAPGTLTLNSLPVANVAIDGKPLGQTTPLRALSLPPGKHHVTLSDFRDPGHQREFDVEIKSGADAKQVVHF